MRLICALLLLALGALVLSPQSAVAQPACAMAEMAEPMLAQPDGADCPHMALCIAVLPLHVPLTLGVNLAPQVFATTQHALRDAPLRQPLPPPRVPS